jgi:hypothetical protein
MNGKWRVVSRERVDGTGRHFYFRKLVIEFPAA